MVMNLFLGFFFGLLTTSLIEKYKKDSEAVTLIDLFRRDFQLSWGHLDSAKYLPNNDVFSCGTFLYRGVKDLSISGVDTYLTLPIHNAQLFEIEGPKLAKYLKRKGRARFWEIYLLSKDIETIRLKLLDKKLGDNDNQYREIIRTLISKLYTELDSFEQDLMAAYPFVTYKIRKYQS